MVILSGRRVVAGLVVIQRREWFLARRVMYSFGWAFRWCVDREFGLVWSVEVQVVPIWRTVIW